MTRRVSGEAMPVSDRARFRVSVWIADPVLTCRSKRAPMPVSVHTSEESCSHFCAGHPLVCQRCAHARIDKARVIVQHQQVSGRLTGRSNLA